MGDKWPLQHRHVLGQAIRIRSPYVDALSVTQVLALRSLRKNVFRQVGVSCLVMYFFRV